jgi:hypothetical protein
VKGHPVDDVPGGRRVDYKLNGFIMALVTYAAFFAGSYLGLWRLTIIYGSLPFLRDFLHRVLIFVISRQLWSSLQLRHPVLRLCKLIPGRQSCRAGKGQAIRKLSCRLLAWY